MCDFSEKTISSQAVYQGMIQLQVDQVELPNGKTSTRDIIKHPGTVGVIAITKENKILMVRQFRKPLEKAIVEIPAGKLDIGERPEICALRELEEETGYCAGKIELLMSFYTAPAYSNEMRYLYKATELSKGNANLDEDEFVEVLELTLEECWDLVQKGEICDARTILVLYMWKYEGF